MVGIGERDVAGRDDPVLVGEAPVLIEPLVEAVEGGEGRLDVALERRFHADAERREHEAGLEPLLIHHGDSGVAVTVLVGDRDEFTKRLTHVGLGDLAAEVVVEAARAGHGIKGRVGDEAVDLAADQESLASVDLRPLHASLVHLGIDVAGERVFGLVVVVVGVERCEGKHRTHDSIVDAVFIAPRIESRVASK